MKAMEGCYRLQKVVCDILFFGTGKTNVCWKLIRVSYIVMKNYLTANLN